MSEIDEDPTTAFVRWLVEVVGYPFNMLFETPPPVDHSLIAAHWNVYNDWGVSIEEARKIIREESGC
jgi:hypothetical protein